MFSIDLDMGFDDATLGGAVSIAFDEGILELDEIVFDSNFGADDPTFRCPTSSLPDSVPCPADDTFASWGNFGTLVGQHGVAQLLFTVVGIGESVIAATHNRAFASPTGSPLPVNFNQIAVVTPEPSTSSLLAIGMGVLAFRRCSRRSSSA